MSARLFDSHAEPLEMAVVVAVSAFVVLVVGSFAGSGIPVVLRRFGLDPALASSIFLTLITDIVGFGGFLLLAAWFL
jgi:magnesium transporter